MCRTIKFANSLNLPAMSIYDSYYFSVVKYKLRNSNIKYSFAPVTSWIHIKKIVVRLLRNCDTVCSSQIHADHRYGSLECPAVPRSAAQSHHAHSARSKFYFSFSTAPFFEELFSPSTELTNCTNQPRASAPSTNASMVQHVPS